MAGHWFTVAKGPPSAAVDAHGVRLLIRLLPDTYIGIE